MSLSRRSPQFLPECSLRMELEGLQPFPGGTPQFPQIAALSGLSCQGKESEAVGQPERWESAGREGPTEPETSPPSYNPPQPLADPGTTHMGRGLWFPTEKSAAGSGVSSHASSALPTVRAQQTVADGLQPL